MKYNEILRSALASFVGLVVADVKWSMHLQAALITRKIFPELIKRQSCHHIGTSQLIRRTNQLTGFLLNLIQSTAVNMDK